MDYLLFVLALFSGGFMAWGVGANDVANAMGTSVGSKIITVKQAIMIAAIFEALGAFFGSGTVTGTIRNNIIQPSLYNDMPLVLAKGMMAALLASATWLMLATQKGWPVSTTHSIVGAVIGFGIISQGGQHIQWSSISMIALSWVVTPLLSGFMGWLVFRIIQRFVLIHPTPNIQATYVSGLFLGLMIMTVVYESLANMGSGIADYVIWATPLVVFLCIWAFKSVMPTAVSYRERCRQVEKMFGVLALFTACAMAFAHGANDVANAIGPLASVVDILQDGKINAANVVPIWILIYGAMGVVLGLAMFGYKIILSVGSKITVLSPSRSFSAQLATAITVLVASWMGFPVSTTHTLVGAVLGVGLARGFAAVNLSVVRGIFMSWGVTIPAGALFSMGYFLLLQAVI